MWQCLSLIGINEACLCHRLNDYQTAAAVGTEMQWKFVMLTLAQSNLCLQLL